MKYGLSNEQLNEIIKIISSYNEIEKAFIFGSRAIDTYKEASDVDIAICGEAVNMHTAGKLKDHLEDETYLPFFFDIIAYNSITNENLKQHIQNKGKVIFQRNQEEWKEVKLEDFTEINPTERLPKGSIAKKIAMEVIQPFTKKIPTYSNEKYEGGVKFKNGDTIMARITPSLENGKTSYVDILDENEIGFGSTEFIVFREKKDVSDKHFVYYLATSPIIRNTAIKSMTGSSGRQRVQTDVVKEHLFYAPELPEQKAIAEVLSSLDDKIDLLHRQNKTLEQIAETLFRQWLIEEAKDDWEEIELGDLGDIICGKTPSKKKKEYFNGNIPFIKIPDMHGKIFIDKTIDKLTEQGKKSQNNKTLPKKSICVSCIATVGLVSMNLEESQTNQQINSIIPYEDYYRYYLYLYMKSSFDLLQSMASGGTATLNLNTGNFSKMKILNPNTNILKEFHSLIASDFDKIEYNQKQICTLEKLRDTLLSKLMSGEVRVEMN